MVGGHSAEVDNSDANVNVAPHDVASALLPGSLKFVAATP